MGLGEIENSWRQETNQTTIKSFQIRQRLTHKAKEPHTSLLCLPLSSFSFRTIPPTDQSPTVFLPASCLKVKSQVDLGLVNLSAAEAVEREATCSEGREHLHPTQGFFFSHFGPTVVVSGTSSFETWPAWEDRGFEGHKFLCYSRTSLTKAQSCITRQKFLGFHNCLHGHYLLVLVSLTLILWPRPLDKIQPPTHLSLSNKKLSLFFLWSICVIRHLFFSFVRRNYR